MRKLYFCWLPTLLIISMGCSTMDSNKCIEARNNSWVLLSLVKPGEIKRISICTTRINDNMFTFDPERAKVIYSTSNIDDCYLVSRCLKYHLRWSHGQDKWGNKNLFGIGCAGWLYIIKISLSDYEYVIGVEYVGFSFGKNRGTERTFFSYPLAYWLNDKVLKATGQKPPEFFVRCLSGEYELERGRKYWLRFKKEEENRSKNLIPTKNQSKRCFMGISWCF